MAETKHTAATPGPWERQSMDDDGAVSIIGADLGGLVGAALPWPTEIDSQDFSRVEANARLIASAPDLLEALKQVMGWISSWDPNFTQDDDWPETEHHVRAALAKAEGSSHD